MTKRADLEPMKMTASKAELFKRACEVNAIRRENHLPLVNVKRYIEAEENRLAWAAYTEAVGQYQPDYEELREKLRQECVDAGKGSLLSSGGRWLLQYKAMKLFEEFLEAKGHFRPMLKGIPYGRGDRA